MDDLRDQGGELGQSFGPLGAIVVSIVNSFHPRDRVTKNAFGNVRTNTSTAHQRTGGSPQIVDHPTALMDVGASFEVGEVTTSGTGEHVSIRARLTTDDIERGTGEIENTR